MNPDGNQQFDPIKREDERKEDIHPVYSLSGGVLTNHLNPDQYPRHAGIW